MGPGEVHAKRRRLWNRGFSSEALMDYEDIIAKHAGDLVEGLERHMDGPIDVVQWINFFT